MITSDFQSGKALVAAPLQRLVGRCSTQPGSQSSIDPHEAAQPRPGFRERHSGIRADINGKIVLQWERLRMVNPRDFLDACENTRQNFARHTERDHDLTACTSRPPDVVAVMATDRLR